MREQCLPQQLKLELHNKGAQMELQNKSKYPMEK